MLDTRKDNETLTDWASRVVDGMLKPKPIEWRLGVGGPKVCSECFAVIGHYANCSKRQTGQALTPVIAILTAFTVALVLIAQSGLLHTICARLAEVR